MKLLLLLATMASLLGQEITYTLVTPTNTLVWSNTNIPSPIGYALYTSTSTTSPGSSIRRVTTLTNSIAASDLFQGATNAIYCVAITALLPSGVETQRSTNIFLYWVPPPSVVASGVSNISVR